MFRRNKHLGHGKTRDVSLGGMKLQNDLPVLGRNDVIIMRIWIDGVEQELRGLVVHTDKNIAGIMLIDMSKDITHAIFNFLKGMEVPLRMALGDYKKSSTPSALE